MGLSYLKQSNFIGPNGPMYPQEIKVGQTVLFLDLVPLPRGLQKLLTNYRNRRPSRVFRMTLLSREMVDGVEESRFDIEMAHKCLT